MSIAPIPDRYLPAVLAGLVLAVMPLGEASAADAAAIAALQKKCDAKDWAACDELASNYQFGFDVAKDEDKAAALYQKACSGGFANACATLGLMLEPGPGVIGNNPRVIALYRQACDANDADGCHYLAGKYDRGEGVPKDAPRALALYRKACDRGSGNACYSLALKYGTGDGVAKDEAKFEALRKQSCKMGSSLCQMMAYEMTVGINLDACNKGDAERCNEIGDAYQFGWEDLEINYDQAAVYQEKACSGGSAEGCTSLGLLYDEGKGVKRDLNQALELWRKGCAGNSPANARGCHLLAISHDLGVGVAKDPARARMLYGKACRLGAKKACGVQVAGADSAQPRPPVAAARPPAAAPADAPPSKAAALQPTTAPVAAGAATTACKVVRMQLGVDTVASVERDIKARGGTPGVGGGGRGKHVLNTLDADFSDAGPGVMAVIYDFDAAGPTGRLIAVRISRKSEFRDTPAAFRAAYSKLATERKSALAKVFGPLQPKSATETTGSMAGCQLTISEDPDAGWLYELYLLPN
jgi:TPR repeat protein